MVRSTPLVDLTFSPKTFPQELESMNWLSSFGLLAICLATLGCGGDTTPKPSGPIDAETQAEIEAHDKEVDDAESALD